MTLLPHMEAAAAAPPLPGGPETGSAACRLQSAGRLLQAADEAPARSRPVGQAMDRGNGTVTAATGRAGSCSKPKRPPPLTLGSDVEIADRIARELERDFDLVHYCEGEF